MNTPIRFKIRHRTRGGHVHCRVFVGRGPGDGALAGELTFRVDEWAELEPFAEALGGSGAVRALLIETRADERL